MLFDFPAGEQRDSVLLDSSLGQFVGFSVGFHVDLGEQESVAPDDGTAPAGFDVRWHPYDVVGGSALECFVHQAMYAG